jgi:hypothetical protein
MDPLSFEDFVYRIALTTDRDRKNKAIPAIRNFSLNPNDNGNLSVDWDKLTTPEDSIARIGAQFKFNSSEFKEFENRELYALNVEKVRSIEGINDVVHDPISESLPGIPKNEAHSLICCSSNEELHPEIFLKLRDTAKDNLVVVNMDIVREKVEVLREKT